MGQENSLQKEMATPSSILAWKISGKISSRQRSLVLQSMELQRVGHGLSTKQQQMTDKQQAHCSLWMSDSIFCCTNWDTVQNEMDAPDRQGVILSIDTTA